jgi:hypothetical protein
MPTVPDEDGALRVLARLCNIGDSHLKKKKKKKKLAGV